MGLIVPLSRLLVLHAYGPCTFIIVGLIAAKSACTRRLWWRLRWQFVARWSVAVFAAGRRRTRAAAALDGVVVVVLIVGGRHTAVVVFTGRLKRRPHPKGEQASRQTSLDRARAAARFLFSPLVRRGGGGSRQPPPLSPSPPFSRSLRLYFSLRRAPFSFSARRVLYFASASAYRFAARDARPTPRARFRFRVPRRVFVAATPSGRRASPPPSANVELSALAVNISWFSFRSLRMTRRRTTTLGMFLNRRGPPSVDVQHFPSKSHPKFARPSGRCFFRVSFPDFRMFPLLTQRRMRYFAQSVAKLNLSRNVTYYLTSFFIYRQSPTRMQQILLSEVVQYFLTFTTNLCLTNMLNNIVLKSP